MNQLFGKDNNHIKVFLHLLNNSNEASIAHCAESVSLSLVIVRDIIKDFEDVGVITYYGRGRSPKFLPMVRFGVNRSNCITIALIEFLNKISEVEKDKPLYTLK